MLGLADSNDPTPPIRLRWSYKLPVVMLNPLIGIAWIAWGSIRIGTSFWDGLIPIVGGAILLLAGIARLTAWRGDRALRRSAPDPGSDGGSADRP